MLQPPQATGHSREAMTWFCRRVTSVPLGSGSQTVTFTIFFTRVRGPMMRNGMRLLLAAATGAVVFASGTATALATQSAVRAADAQCSKTDEFSKVEWTEAFVPLKDNNDITVTLTLKNPFKKDGDG